MAKKKKKTSKRSSSEASLLRRFKEEQRLKKQIGALSPLERAQFESFKSGRRPQITIGEKITKAPALKDLGQQVSGFGMMGQRQPDFSTEQMALKSMFGGGEKIWGQNMQPVEMYHDLNPRQRGDTGTAEMFGFG
jgi:hypothetical protein